ncbi:MAG TPA: SIS domain-containing protein, partial [Candidatus Synoicihabitans sp.]|nr:SIS domain-containing protein [Candidatus Synoicihabitans sp.]
MTPAIAQLAQNYPDLLPCLPDVQAAYERLVACFEAQGKLLVCGNGGSAADADHIVGELVKGFMLKRALPPTLKGEFARAYGDAGRHLAEHLQGAL